MSEPFYVSRAEVGKLEERHHRRARLEAGPEIDMGVHGAVREYYKLIDAPNLPLPVDYIVAATGG
jgi:hypothetical protein